MFVIIGFILFIVVLFMFYFTALSFRRMEILKDKKKVIAWCLSFIPIIIVFSVFNMVNALIIVLHYALILIVVNLIMLILKKKSNNLLVLISVLLTIIYFGYGAYESYHISETKYDINTSKDVSDLKIIQIADTHVGATFDGKGFASRIKKISEIEADIFVITGDFIDDDTTKEDMIDACSALSLLHPKYGVYFVNGNHDRGYYSRDYSYEDLTNELVKNNVKVLIDEVVEINDDYVLVGREDRQYSRKDIKELVSEVDKSKYIIDLNHQPNDYNNEQGQVDLVLSGHTHGGQLFPLQYVGKMIGANDETYGLHKRKNTNFIVNSGMSSWAIDFKTGTHSEYVIINIHGEENE